MITSKITLLLSNGTVLEFSAYNTDENLQLVAELAVELNAIWVISNENAA